MELSDRIKTIRKSKHITQKELAARINKSFSTVQKYELGKATPPLDVLGDIARELNVPINKLLGYEDMGVRIQQLREKHGLSHSEMSQKTGIPARTIKRYEEGVWAPKAKDLQLIALSLSESVGALVGYGDDNLTTILIAEHPDDVVILDERGTPHFYYEETLEQQKQLDSLFMKLNEEGQRVAVERVEELTKIPDYQKKTD